MPWNQEIKKYTKLSLLLVTFILSIDFTDAKKGKWKPGNENYRRFPIDRTLQHDGSIPTGKEIQNDRIIQIGRKMQDDRRISIDRTLQNDRKTPTGKAIQNDRRLQINGKMQNDKRIFIDRRLQNDRKIPTDKVIQNDGRLQSDANMKHDSKMQYNRRLNSAGITDRIMQEDRRRRINKLLENDRLSETELQKKIDSLTQNKNILQIDERVKDGGIMLQGLENDTKTQNGSKVQNTRRILDERFPKMINARRTEYDERMWVATPHRPARLGRHSGSPTGPISSEASKERSRRNTRKWDKPEGGVWHDFHSTVMGAMKAIHYTRPDTHHWLVIRACHVIGATYISAYKEYRSYYSIRYFYENNLEYEIGYLVSEIISKYQKMLELYNLATEYFYKHQIKQYSPSAYVLYVYTAVLEMGTVISHLCNMLDEMEDKYMFIPANQSGFSDYHLQKRAKPLRPEDLVKITAAYQKALARLQKKKLKERNKKREEELGPDMTITPPSRKPKNEYKNWPIIYGWSIETDW